MTLYNAFRDNLLGRESVVDTDRCVVCGRYANNEHHVIPKGMGSVPRHVERMIPRLKLCGSGTTGCHGKAHAKRLHFAYTDTQGWLWFESRAAIDDELAWKTYRHDYRRIRNERLATFGRGR